MPTQVLMPQLGESVNEGTISRWLKTPGERVEEYEALVEVNTDKVDTEIPSPVTGTLLEIIVPAGAVAKAGAILATIARLEEPAAPSRDTIPSKAEAGPGTKLPVSRAALEPGSPPLPESGEGPDVRAAHPSPPGRGAGGEGKITPGRHPQLGFISPLVARLANDHQVDLTQVTGSGLDGRITKNDLQAYLDRPVPPPAAPAPAAPQPPRQASAPPPPPSAVLPGEILPLTSLRRSIAEHMVFSERTSPHVSTFMEVDLSRVVAHRQAHKQAFAGDGVNLTFTAYFIAAAAAALKAYPMVNASWTDEGIRLHRPVNIGMATSLGEAGLIVPVIKNASDLSLLGIARAVNDLAERARARKLLPDEVQGGTFTITNHGVSGSLFATPIINQPQCAILSVGAMQKRPVVITDPNLGDVIAIRPMAYFGLTFDHRILDGASADYFLAHIVTALRDWS